MDDVSGVAYVPELGKEAREVEMTFFRRMKVYTRVPRAMQQIKEGRLLGYDGWMPTREIKNILT